MFYHLFTYLQEQGYDFPGIGLFDYISFRSAMAIVTSLLISMVFGNRLIRLLHRKQVGELVRDLGLEGQKEKEGTPTMGGLIILGAIIIPTLLFAKIDNIYTITMLLATVWLGLIGFLDDYIKVFKKNKKGLAGKFKIVGQIGVGIIVGSLLYFHSDVTIKERIQPSQFDTEIASSQFGTSLSGESEVQYGEEVKSRSTTIPFIKNNEFNYEWLLPKSLKDYTWIVFILMTIIIVTAVSNGANMTDGLDGLATGTSAIIGITLAIFAYVSGNAIFADYLNIMYIPNSGELVIFISSFIGACVGFLWHNSYLNLNLFGLPKQTFGPFYCHALLSLFTPVI